MRGTEERQRGPLALVLRWSIKYASSQVEKIKVKIEIDSDRQALREFYVRYNVIKGLDGDS